MTALTLLAVGRLTASADDRTLTGVLLPFNQPGRTNLGRLTASADSQLTLAEVVPLNIEHRDTDIIGKAVKIEKTAAGLEATFSVLPTRAGDDALAEVAAGLRACLSVEVDPIVTTGGRIVSGVVSGGALVAKPAFAGAKLTAAEDGPVPDLGEQATTATDTPDVVIDGAELENVQTVEVTTEQITITTEQAAPAATQEEPTTMTASAVTVQNPALKATATKPAGVTRNKLYAALAAAQNGGPALAAALSDITPPNILGIEQPQYVGELWSGKAYQRKIVPLFNHSDLTSFRVSGWRWVTKPQVGNYTGNKTDVPSNTVSTAAVDIEATRIAGAHDIDRKFRDFSNAEFWAAYFAAMTESYAKVSDADVLDDVLAAAPDITPGAVPAGVSTAMSYIVDGALAILADTDSMPSFAVVSLALWRGLVLTRTEDTLAYLNAALGLEDGTIGNFAVRPSAQLPGNQVLVGCKEAVTVHELGGEAPIRVEALDIARGGIDNGVFGYLAVNVHDTGGLAQVIGA